MKQSQYLAFINFGGIEFVFFVLAGFYSLYCCCEKNHQNKITITIDVHNVDFAFFQFMTRVITQAVMKMRESCPLNTPSPVETGSPPASTISRLKLSDAGRWPDTILSLADQFGLDLDFLKRHHVCELYSAGFDKLAEEVCAKSLFCNCFNSEKSLHRTTKYFKRIAKKTTKI